MLRSTVFFFFGAGFGGASSFESVELWPLLMLELMVVTSFLNSFLVPLPFRYFPHTDEPEEELFLPSVLLASGRLLFLPSFFVTRGGRLEAVDDVVDVLKEEVSDDEEDEEEEDEDDDVDDVEGLDVFCGTFLDLEVLSPLFLAGSELFS